MNARSKRCLERTERHEERCRMVASNVRTLRRFCGRWQVLRSGQWRDLDPRRTYNET